MKKFKSYSFTIFNFCQQLVPEQMFKFSRLHLFFLQVWIWRTTRRGRWWGWSRWWRRWSWPDSGPARASARKSILKHGIFKNGIVFIVNSSTCHIFHRSNGLRTQSVDVGTRMNADLRFEWTKVVWRPGSRDGGDSERWLHLSLDIPDIPPMIGDAWPHCTTATTTKRNKFSIKNSEIQIYFVIICR